MQYEINCFSCVSHTYKVSPRFTVCTVYSLLQVRGTTKKLPIWIIRHWEVELQIKPAMEADGREPVWPPHANSNEGGAGRRLISLQSVRSPMQHDGVSSSQVDSSEVYITKNILFLEEPHEQFIQYNNVLLFVRMDNSKIIQILLTYNFLTPWHMNYVQVAL